MIALITGPNFYELSGFREEPAETRFGRAFPLRGEAGGREILVLPRHGTKHRNLPHPTNYRANLVALQEAGATALASLSVCGLTNAAWPLVSATPPRRSRKAGHHPNARCPTSRPQRVAGSSLRAIYNPEKDHRMLIDLLGLQLPAQRPPRESPKTKGSSAPERQEHSCRGDLSGASIAYQELTERNTLQLRKSG